MNEPDGTVPVFGQSQGTIAVDDGNYTAYHMQVGDGARLVCQTYSVRTEGRPCGHISISDHFAQWANLELRMGALAEVKFLVEGMGRGAGSYEFTRASLSVK